MIQYSLRIRDGAVFNMMLWISHFQHFISINCKYISMIRAKDKTLFMTEKFFSSFSKLWHRSSKHISSNSTINTKNIFTNIYADIILMADLIVTGDREWESHMEASCRMFEVASPISPGWKASQDACRWAMSANICNDQCSHIMKWNE